MFTEFYHGVTGGNIIFKDGKISGSLHQQAVAPFPEHQQELSGTYSADRFEMRIAMPLIMGVQSYQYITGLLVEPV